MEQDKSKSREMAGPRSICALRNRPRSIHQYSNMAPRLAGQNCKFLKFLLYLNSQKRIEYKENNTEYRSGSIFDYAQLIFDIFIYQGKWLVMAIRTIFYRESENRTSFSRQYLLQVAMVRVQELTMTINFTWEERFIIVTNILSSFALWGNGMTCWDTLYMPNVCLFLRVHWKFIWIFIEYLLNQ